MHLSYQHPNFIYVVLGPFRVRWPVSVCLWIVLGLKCLRKPDLDKASFLHLHCCVLTSPRRRHVMEWYWCCWPTNWTGQTRDKWRLRRGRGSQRCSTFEYSNWALQGFTHSPELTGSCSNTRRCFMSAVPKLGATLRKWWQSSPGRSQSVQLRWVGMNEWHAFILEFLQSICCIFLSAAIGYLWEFQEFNLQIVLYFF